MDKSILLFEDNRDLRENIEELLGLNGLSVKIYSSSDLISFPAVPNSIGICNELTMLLPTDVFIKMLMQKTTDIILLCSDTQRKNFNDEMGHVTRVQMPFKTKEFMNIILKIRNQQLLNEGQGNL